MCIYYVCVIERGPPATYTERERERERERCKRIYLCMGYRCVMERSPPATYLSRVCGPRYLEAIMGHDENRYHLILVTSHMSHVTHESCRI